MEDNNIEVYEPVLHNLEGETDLKLGTKLISYTKNPAVIIRGVAFNNQFKKELNFRDDLKMRIAAPIMVPGDIYREPEGGNEEFEVRFTVEKIAELYNDFMARLSNQNKFNVEHTKEIAPSHVFEGMLVENVNKQKFIKAEYNIDLPIGSAFLVSQVTDRKYYDALVEADKLGFSIEGLFGLELVEKKEKNNNLNMSKKLKLSDGDHIIGNEVWTSFNGEFTNVRQIVQTKLDLVDEVKEDEEVKAEEEVKEDEKVEATDEVKEDEEVKAEDEVKEEEVKAEDEVKEDEEVKAEGEVKEDEKVEAQDEEVTDESVEVVDEEEISPAVQSKLDAIYEEIAALKAMILNEKESEEEVKEEEVKMSVHDRLNNYRKFSNK